MHSETETSFEKPNVEFSRRTMVKQLLVASGVTALCGPETLVPALAQETQPAQKPDSPTNKTAHFRGVNLGGWLVLEKWITPGVFANVDAGDEYTFGSKLGHAAATERLRAHRKKFITEADFKWIAEHGLNAVRIPVGYWVLDAEEPFVEGKETLDQAFAWAKKYKLGVVLDLHGAPGSQNGNDHSGKSGPLEWHTKPENIAKTLDVLEALAKRYKDQESLVALELLNEPRWDVPLDILKKFYKDAYHRVRPYLPADRVAIMFHDGFRPMDWKDYMKEAEYLNVILDTHIYQCFTDEDRKRSAPNQIQKAIQDHRNQVETMNVQELPTCVGEWSLGLPGETYAGLSPTAQDGIKRAYAGAQLMAFEQAAAGWFFWTYKTETALDWSLRDCVDRGWFPQKFA